MQEQDKFHEGKNIPGAFRENNFPNNFDSVYCLKQEAYRRMDRIHRRHIVFNLKKAGEEQPPSTFDLQLTNIRNQETNLRRTFNVRHTIILLYVVEKDFYFYSIC